nr:F-box/kelch-repeat protein At3g06240-like [Quercus suber]
MFNRISDYSIPSDFSSKVTSIVGSCNGLLCVAAYNSVRTYAEIIFLWNPSIRKFKRLPNSCLSQIQYAFATGFSYQSHTRDYKVIKIFSLSVAEVYTLSSDSWRRVEISLTPNAVVLRMEYFSSAIFFSGALHWFAKIKAFTNGKFRRRSMILSFDVDNEKFKEMALPVVDKVQNQSLVVFKGNLAFITVDYLGMNFQRLNPRLCSIWVMAEYGVPESWNKLFSVRLENVVKFIGCTWYGELLVQKNVKAKSDARELLSFNDDVIVSFDPETLHEKKLDIQQVPNTVSTFMESLVLLDGEIELSG